MHEQRGEESAAFAATPMPCLERGLPAGGTTWVHGYTFAEAAKWKQAARTMAGGREPTRDHLAIAQVAWVCRVEPGSAEFTFKLSLHDAPQGFQQLAAHLPAKWVEQACLESDMLSLEGYYPPPRDDKSGATFEAIQRLGEQLADEELWQGLSLVSLKLYGVPLAENGRPLGEVLSHLERDVELRHRLAETFAPLAALVAGEE